MKLPINTLRNKGWFQGDMTIWMVLILLCSVSIIEVYSASSSMSYKSGVFWGPVLEHTMYVLFGIGTAFVFHLMNCKIFKPMSFIFIIISVGLLFYAMFFGQKINDGSRWISIAGRTIQPSEIAKLSTIVFIALLMTIRNKETGEAARGGVKLSLIVIFGMCLFIATENFSTAAMLFLVCFAMLWIAKTPSKVLLWILGVLGGLALTIFVTVKSMSPQTARNIGENISVLHRLPTWVSRLQKDHSLPENPDDYDVSNNQQVAHAQIAIATCGVIGKGPGKSVERDYLPQAFSDFIFAIIIEEGGIESAIFVLFLYLFLFYRSLRIASNCATRFPAYLVMGLSLMLVVQALINMAVAVGLAPVTGQPLPLISRGGTSTIISCIYIGMILSVSRTASKIKNEKELATVPVAE